MPRFFNRKFVVRDQSETHSVMKHLVLLLSMAVLASAATAQTPAKTAAPGAAGKASTAARPAAARTTANRLPAGIPPVRGLVKPAFSLKYQDIKIGAGAEAEPNKLYKVFYTGWLGNNGRPDDGRKFDSSDDHRRPALDKDGKPVMGPDGKPKLGDPQPLEFPQGFGRLIPGFDQGFGGMKIGGKRRLFIPWQLAYGAHGRPGPDAAHPGIPPKADLIFDIELVDVTDMPTPGGMPGARPMPGGMPHPGTPLPPGHPQTTAPAPQPGASPSDTAKPAAPATPGAAPAQPETPPKASTPATPPQPQSK
jgi:peptidylprolyl isomerase